MITVRKLKVRCNDKSFYNFFNIEQREQNKALNMAISLIHSNNVLKSIDSGAEIRILKGIDKLNSKIDKLNKELESEKITEKKKAQMLKSIETNKKILNGEMDILEEGKEFRQGLDKQFTDIYINNNNLYQVLNKQTQVQYMRTLDLVKQKITLDYSNNFTDIVTGKCSLMNYKNDFPLMIDNSCINLFEENGIYKIKIMLGYELEIVIGNRINENIIELKQTLEKSENGAYKICQSSIQEDKNNNIIFNLTLDIPKETERKVIEGRVLGVDLGIKYPVYMCLGDDTYKRQSLGNINNFLRVRQQMQERRKKVQKDLTLTNGGKGRAKKIQLLEKLTQNEKNFCKTYNHALSKRIVEFAKKYKCEYIHLEKLTKDGFSNTILRNWSYYELQNMIKYKSERDNIKVRYVDPSYTSQTCSKCGHVDKENRKTQEKFKCTNCGFELNADHNASINIARSDNFI